MRNGGSFKSLRDHWLAPRPCARAHCGVTDAPTFQRPFTLGIEGGGTRTTALLADARGREIQRGEFGPGNVRLLDDLELVRLL